MIRLYSGVLYREGVRDEEHEEHVTERDGYYHGVCDVCGEAVESDDVGSLVSPDKGEIRDCAIDSDWTVIGDHLLCSGCVRAVELGEKELEFRLTDPVKKRRRR